MPAEDALAAVLHWKSHINDAALYSDYYDGNHKYSFASPKFLRRYQWVIEQSRENLCPAVVDSFAAKLVIQSWEGDEAAVKGMTQKVDELGLDTIYDQVHTEAPKCGDAFVLVWPDGDRIDRPWVKLAEQSAWKPDPRRPGKLLWYALVMVDDDGRGRVNVYYDNQCERYVTSGKVRQMDGDSLATQILSWPDKPESYAEYTDDGEPAVITHEYGRVPAVWFPYKARQSGADGRSVLTDVIPLQDGLNKSVADVIVNSEAYAMPLRYLLGWKPKKKLNPDTGQPEEEKLKFDPSTQGIFAVDGPGPFGQLDPPDVTKVLSIHDAFANKISRVVGLPAFYVSAIAGEPPSGVSLRVLSTRLTNSSRVAQRVLTRPWADVAALLGFEGIRPVWLDPAPTDETEQLENALIRKEIGYDQETILTKLGEDPDDVKRIMDAKTEQAPAIGGPALVRSLESGMSLEDQTA